MKTIATAALLAAGVMALLWAGTPALADSPEEEEKPRTATRVEPPAWNWHNTVYRHAEPVRPGETRVKNTHIQPSQILVARVNEAWRRFLQRFEGIIKTIWTGFQPGIFLEGTRAGPHNWQATTGPTQPRSGP